MKEEVPRFLWNALEWSPENMAHVLSVELIPAWPKKGAPYEMVCVVRGHEKIFTKSEEEPHRITYVSADRKDIAVIVELSGSKKGCA